VGRGAGRGGARAGRGAAAHGGSAPGRLVAVAPPFASARPSWPPLRPPPPAGKGHEELARWRKAYEWLFTSPSVKPGTPVLISMHQPRAPPPPQPAPGPDATLEEKKAYYKAMAAARVSGCIFPRVFAALTPGGSIIGAAAVVVHT
jgi:hypothetical protein